MVKFRFQDLEIWKLAIQIADELFDIADELERKLQENHKFPKVVTQMRRFALHVLRYTLCEVRYALRAFRLAIVALRYASLPLRCAYKELDHV